MSDSFINRSRVRKLALAAAENRAHKFTSVGKSFYDRLEGAVRRWVAEEVARHPSKGKTLK